MNPKEIIAPTTEPVDLLSLKRHCKVTDDVENSDFQDYLVAARVWLETFLARQLITATYDYYLDAWPSGTVIVLPRPPLQSVTSITYYNEAGVLATMSASDYQVDAVNEPGRVILAAGKTWPSVVLRPALGVVIRIVAGYGDAAATVPGPIRHALKLLTANSWAERQIILVGASETTLPFGIWESLLGYRIGLGVS